MNLKACLLLLAFLPASVVAGHSDFYDAAIEYLEFAEHKAGIITPAQLHKAGLNNVMLINVNHRNQYEEGDTLPDSLHMDWREVLKRHKEIPEDRTVVVYCNSMLYSSRAQLLLNMDGYDNVLLLQGGLNNYNRYISENTITE